MVIMELNLIENIVNTFLFLSTARTGYYRSTTLTAEVNLKKLRLQFYRCHTKPTVYKFLIQTYQFKR